jgi:integrase
MDRTQIWLLRRPTRKTRKRRDKKGNVKTMPVLSYAIQWTDPRTGKTKTETIGQDERAAMVKLSERRKELDEGVYKEVKTVSWNDFAIEHLERLKNAGNDGTYAVHRTSLGNFQRICKPKKLSDVDFNMLEHFRDSRTGEGAAPATTNKELKTMRAALTKAVLRGYLKRNPMKGIQKDLLLPEPEKQVVTIPDEGFNQLLTGCKNNQWRAICWIAYESGLRSGEIMALEWKDLDFDENLIRVSNKTFHNTKTGKARTVPMSENIKKHLDPLRVNMFKSNMVFLTNRGTWYSHNAWSRFNNIVLRAGLVDDDGKAKYSLHDLRRTFATKLANNGISPKVLKELMGHTKLETTMGYYVNAGLSEKRKAIQQITKVG